MLALLLLLFGHQFEHPKVIRVGIKDQEILIAVSYDVSPGRDAVQIRALFDRDADGAMSEGEQDKLAKYLEQMAMLFFSLEVNGEKVTPERKSATPHRVDLPSSAPDTLGIALLYAVRIPDGPDLRIRLADRARDRTKHVPVVVDLTEEWEVRFSSQGELVRAPFGLRRIRLATDRPWQLHLRRRS